MFASSDFWSQLITFVELSRTAGMLVEVTITELRVMPLDCVDAGKGGTHHVALQTAFGQSADEQVDVAHIT